MARRFGDVWGYRNPLRNSISGLEIPVNQPIDGVADITSFPQICRAVSLLFGRRSQWRCVLRMRQVNLLPPLLVSMAMPYGFCTRDGCRRRARRKTLQKGSEGTRRRAALRHGSGTHSRERGSEMTLENPSFQLHGRQNSRRSLKRKESHGSSGE